MRTKETNIASENVQNSVGKQLQQLREEKGLSLVDVSENTRISVKNLKALEEHDYAKLPADTFTKGHLILYATFLEIDGNQTAARFMAERSATHRPGKTSRMQFENHSLNPDKFAEPSHIHPMTVAGILLALILISFTSFCLYTSWNPFSFLFDRTKTISNSVMGVFLPDQTVSPTLVYGKQLVVQAKFNQDTDVKITRDEQAQDQLLFLPGQAIEWQAARELRLEISPPGSAEILVNGKPVAFPPEHNGIFLFQLKQ